MSYSLIMQTIIETPEFLSASKKLLSVAEVDALKNMLARNPEAGELMVGTGGCRKVRLARTGSGKSGGYRVVTFYRSESTPLYLLTVYAKKDKDNLTKSERNTMKEMTDKL